MSDETRAARPGDGGIPGANGQATAEQRPPIIIHGQYVKDLSFEAPLTPGILGQLQRQQPNISVKFDKQDRVLDAANNLFEVVIQISSECKVGEETAFVVELSYGGVFTLNVRPEDLRPVLMIECPRLLFPFARQLLASATMNGGFPPLMLGPIDFAALYQNDLAEAQGSRTDPVTVV